MPIFTPRRSVGTQLSRWRTAADPAAAVDPEEEEFGKKVEQTKEDAGGVKPPAEGAGKLLTVTVAALVGKAKEYLDRYKINAKLDKDPSTIPPESTGYDLSFRLQDPSFKGALLTFSWTKNEGIRSWLSGVTKKLPDQITLYFCDAIYVATAKQLDPLLASLATIQTAMMHAATPEETAIYELIKNQGKPSKAPDAATQKGRDEQEQEALNDRVMATVNQLQSNNPRMDSSNAGIVLEEAKDSFKENNITKQQLNELVEYIKKVKTDGWKKFVTDLTSEGKDTAHKNVALETNVAELVTKLTDGKYKGQPQVGYSSKGGKNYVMAVLSAPFPFQFRFLQADGGKLILDGASARICQNDYVVKAPEAKDLMYAVLALGIAAKQAAQVPEEVRNRGRKRQELPEDQAKELDELINETGGGRRREQFFNGTFYKVVVDQLAKLTGRSLSDTTQKNAEAVFTQTKIPGKTFAQFFKMVAKDLGFKITPAEFQELALEVAGETNPATLGDGVDSILHELTGVA